MKRKICGIYKITSPINKVYIGQSINIKNRFSSYKRLNCINQTKLYNSFKYYGIDKHKFEILQECDIEQLNELEVYYIELFQCLNSKYGLNLQIGGKVNNNYLTSKKISNYYIEKNLPITSIIDMVLEVSKTQINYFKNITEYIEF